MENIRVGKFRKDEENTSSGMDNETPSVDRADRLRIGKGSDDSGASQSKSTLFNVPTASVSSTTNSSASTSPNIRHNRKHEKINENLFWNLCVIKTELDNLHAFRNECQAALDQVNL